MIEYVYDFLSGFFDKLKDKNKVRSIILFGSFARGNSRKDSDVDLFIDVSLENIDELNRVVGESLNEFEIKSQKTWRLRGIKNEINVIVGDINSEQWKELKRDISNYGIVLFGQYALDKKAEKNSVLLSYNLSKLKQKNKMKVIRLLKGYSLKKGKKVYSQKGMLEGLGGESIENAIILPIKNHNAVLEILRKNGVSVRIREFRE